jgi:hypothetical protein
MKNYRFVIYRKWTDFLVNMFLSYCESLSLAWTNTPAYYRICKLRIHNVFIAQSLTIPLGVLFHKVSFLGAETFHQRAILSTCRFVNCFKEDLGPMF